MIFINCKNKILGRISSIIAKMILFFDLYNKNKIFFIFNVIDIAIRNKNLKISHSGKLGKLKKEIKFKRLLFFFKKSIYNMLPKNKKRIILMKKIFFIKKI